MVQYHLVEKIIGRIHFRPHLVECRRLQIGRMDTEWTFGRIRCSVSKVQSGRIYTSANWSKIGIRSICQHVANRSKIIGRNGNEEI